VRTKACRIPDNVAFAAYSRITISSRPAWQSYRGEEHERMETAKKHERQGIGVRMRLNGCSFAAFARTLTWSCVIEHSKHGPHQALQQLAVGLGTRKHANPE
jgi:hypothetical protein